MAIDLHQWAVPTVHRETCAACGQCVRFCPSQTLVLHDGKVEVQQQSFFGCIGCGHCMMICPKGAITVTGRRLGPEDAVELTPEETRATAEQLHALLLARRSVRHFGPEEVDRRAVDRILEITATAPTGVPPSEVGTPIPIIGLRSGHSEGVLLEVLVAVRSPPHAALPVRPSARLAHIESAPNYATRPLQTKDMSVLFGVGEKPRR